MMACYNRNQIYLPGSHAGHHIMLYIYFYKHRHQANEGVVNNTGM